MTQHLSDSTKWKLSTFVLEGESFSQVANRFNISKAGAAKIFHLVKFRIFPLLYERERLGIDMNDIKTLRDGWWKIKGL